MKWLTRIDVLTAPYPGEFQTGHYMYEWARITEPAPAAVIGAGTCTVRSKAWSGNRTGDPGRGRPHREGEWNEAQLHAPGGPYQWQDRSFDWAATQVGRHTLRAKATDAAGNVPLDLQRPDAE